MLAACARVHKRGSQRHPRGPSTAVATAAAPKNKEGKWLVLLTAVEQPSHMHCCSKKHQKLQAVAQLLLLLHDTPSPHYTTPGTQPNFGLALSSPSLTPAAAVVQLRQPKHPQQRQHRPATDWTAAKAWGCTRTARNLGCSKAGPNPGSKQQCGAAQLLPPSSSCAAACHGGGPPGQAAGVLATCPTAS
jgi:hypothetical protein